MFNVLECFGLHFSHHFIPMEQPGNYLMFKMPEGAEGNSCLTVHEY